MEPEAAPAEEVPDEDVPFADQDTQTATRCAQEAVTPESTHEVLLEPLENTKMETKIAFLKSCTVCHSATKQADIVAVQFTAAAGSILDTSDSEP